jgi:hypothetical protein
MLIGPNHRITGGKVEHFQQTIEKWLEARPKADSLAELGSATSATVDAEKIWRIGSCTQAAHAVHGMHAMHSANIPRSVGCST